jgi:hypothetical protein
VPNRSFSQPTPVPSQTRRGTAASSNAVSRSASALAPLNAQLSTLNFEPPPRHREPVTPLESTLPKLQENKQL